MSDTRSSATGSKSNRLDALGLAKPDLTRIDLSMIREPMRSMLLKQMEKMPAQMREQLLRDGSPLLDRLIAKARDRESAMVAPLPASDASSISPGRIQTVRHANGSAAPVRVQTVSPGDAAGGGMWFLVCVIVLLGAVWVAMHGG